MDDSCPFCRSSLHNDAFLRSENFLAIYNIAPVLPGHALVMSARHIESTFEMNAKERSEFVEFMQRTTHILLKAFKGEGFDWSLQEKGCAGQSISHLHIHIVVRQPGDLDSEGKWYPLVEENDNHLLDSHQRPKLTRAEIASITGHLKMVAGQLSEK